MGPGRAYVRAGAKTHRLKEITPNQRPRFVWALSALPSLWPGPSQREQPNPVKLLVLMLVAKRRKIFLFLKFKQIH